MRGRGFHEEHWKHTVRPTAGALVCAPGLCKERSWCVFLHIRFLDLLVILQTALDEFLRYEVPGICSCGTKQCPVCHSMSVKWKRTLQLARSAGVVLFVSPTAVCLAACCASAREEHRDRKSRVPAQMYEGNCRRVDTWVTGRLWTIAYSCIKCTWKGIDQNGWAWKGP